MRISDYVLSLIECTDMYACELLGVCVPTYLRVHVVRACAMHGSC